MCVHRIKIEKFGSLYLLSSDIYLKRKKVQQICENAPDGDFSNYSMENCIHIRLEIKLDIMYIYFCIHILLSFYTCIRHCLVEFIF
jgi:hypothetical protein